MRDHTCSWSSCEVSALLCSGLRTVVCVCGGPGHSKGRQLVTRGGGRGGGGEGSYLFLVF